MVVVAQITAYGHDSSRTISPPFMTCMRSKPVQAGDSLGRRSFRHNRQSCVGTDAVHHLCTSDGARNAQDMRLLLFYLYLRSDVEHDHDRFILKMLVEYPIAEFENVECSKYQVCRRAMIPCTGHLACVELLHEVIERNRINIWQCHSFVLRFFEVSRQCFA